MQISCAPYFVAWILLQGAEEVYDPLYIRGFRVQSFLSGRYDKGQGGCVQCVSYQRYDGGDVR